MEVCDHKGPHAYQNSIFGQIFLTLLSAYPPPTADIIWFFTRWDEVACTEERRLHKMQYISHHCRTILKTNCLFGAGSALDGLRNGGDVLHLISSEKLIINDLSMIQILSKWGKVTRRVIYQRKGNLGVSKKLLWSITWRTKQQLAKLDGSSKDLDFISFSAPAPAFQNDQQASSNQNWPPRNHLSHLHRHKVNIYPAHSLWRARFHESRHLATKILFVFLYICGRKTIPSGINQINSSLSIHSVYFSF